MTSDSGSMSLIAEKLGADVAYCISELINKRLCEHCIARHTESELELKRQVANLANTVVDRDKQITELNGRISSQAKTIESYQAQRVNACAIIQELHTVVHSGGGGGIMRLANLTTSLKEVMGMIEDD